MATDVLQHLNATEERERKTLKLYCVVSRVKIALFFFKVERGSTFTFTRDLPYNIVSILFTQQWKSTLTAKLVGNRSRIMAQLLL